MRLSSSLRSKQIKFTDFVSVLHRQLGSTWGSPPKEPHHLGVAVSGGVDSMALVMLCKQYAARPKHDRTICTAFIVDHRVRSGSAEEAQQVSQYLESKNIRTEILTLNWPSDVIPSKLADLESQMRILRYQALGRACRNRAIHALLLAHHADDQAENVLIRLANGYDGMGLRGMQANADMPECFGLYGVYQSGQPMHLEQRLEDQSMMDARGARGTNGIERGGIKICRPLLGFTKNQLIATCERGRVRWFEDETNRQRTLTVRNSVRYLMRSDLLPSALKTEPLLKLAAKIDHRLQTRDGGAEGRFYQTRFGLDIRTGRLVIRHLPDLTIHSNRENTMVVALENQDLRKKTLQQIAARLLQRLISLVTPQQSVPLRDLEHAALIMFPHLWDQPCEDLRSPSFTVAGVKFSQLIVANESESAEAHWILHRQPMTYLERQKCTVMPIATKSPNHPVKASQKLRSHWMLWDGRFWIRLYAHELGKYVIRPFEAEDQAEYLKGISSTHLRWLTRVLRQDAKEKIKWTLPAIVKHHDPSYGQDTQGRDKVVALPTLGSKLEGEPIEWDVHYKSVDLGRRGLDMLEPPFALASPSPRRLRSMTKPSQK